MTVEYVTLDESVYLNLHYGERGDFDPDVFDTAFVAAPVAPGSVPDWGWEDLTQRPDSPPHSPLWRSFQYPLTPLGMFLWKDGTIKVTNSWYDSAYLSADDKILGGHVWYAPTDSWQAQVLRDAGYPLIPYGGPIV